MTGSWKTTVAGLASAAAAFVLFAHTSFNITFPQWALALATFTTVGGLAALGVAAKDSNVTGGTVGQPSTPQALADANQAPAVGPAAPPLVPAVANAIHVDPVAVKQALIDAQHKLEGKP